MYPLEKVQQYDDYIDLDKSYSEVEIMEVSKVGSDLYFILKDSKVKVSEFKGRLFPNIINGLNKYKGRASELPEYLRKNSQILKQVIFESEKRMVSIKEALNIYQCVDLNEEESEALLKLSIAEKWFEYKSHNNKDFLKLSNKKIEFEKIKDISNL
jgi:hypothetical protein